MVSGIKWRLAPVGVKALIFIPRKSVNLSGLGVLFSNIQQGLLGTRHVSLSNWWSVSLYCLGQLLLGLVDVPDTCRALTAAAHPCQLLSVPASCDHIGRGLPVVVNCLHIHFVQQAIGLFRPIHNLVNQLAAWFAVLLRSLKLASGGRLETPTSWPI